MPVDPYGNPPSREDLKQSGTEDWVEEALKQQRQKEAALLGGLGGETESLDRSRLELAGLLELPPEDPDDEAAAPDLFAQERQKGEAERVGLSGIFGEDVARRQAEERALLGDMFGTAPTPRKAKKSPG